MAGYEGTIGINLLILVGLIPLGILTAYFLLRMLNKLNGLKFTQDVLLQINTDPLACAVYYGIRFASVLAFVAYLCGRYV